MDIVIRGDKIKITEAMKDYIEEKISKLNKYLEDSDDVHGKAVVRVRNHQQIVEVTIPLKSFILRSEESQEDFYAAVDKAVDKLERQIRKNKTKLMSKKINTHDFSFADIEEIKDEDNSKVVKRKTVAVKPMAEEEAIIQMELLNHQFYMYKDSDTNKPSVVYKRKDGGYGVIESE